MLAARGNQSVRVLFVFTLFVSFLGPAFTAYAEPTIEIHQEHEGNLNGPSEDSTGDVFRYYRIARPDPEISAQVTQSLSIVDRAGYWWRRRVRGQDEWSALPTHAKIQYLQLQEKKLGESACWSGAACELLERRDDAPAYLDRHPRMEVAPGTDQRSFFLPEIITDRDHPARSVEEALNRARRIVSDTGNAGMHFHVFFSIEPERMRQQLPALLSFLQLYNDDLYLGAARDNFVNLLRENTQPWHSGKSRTVVELVQRASREPHIPMVSSLDSEKGASLAFRYWGIENGKMRISLELRGSPFPWIRPPAPGRGAGIGSTEGQRPPPPYRDFSYLRAHLDDLVTVVNRLQEGKMVPVNSAVARVLDAARAESLIRQRARERNLSEGSYLGLGEYTRKVSLLSEVPPGYLLPFSDSTVGLESPALRAYIDGFLELSEEAARMKNPADHHRSFDYRFWLNYREWAHAKLLLAREERSRLLGKPTSGPKANCITDWAALVRQLDGD